MPRSTRDPGAGRLPGGSMDLAVCAGDDTTDLQPDSSLKSAVVDALRWIFERSPVLAAALGKLVMACWRGFKEA